MTASYSVGRFFHHGWEITTGHDPLLNRMASLHEFGHLALNSSTAWGALLQQLALAHRFTGDPAIARTLTAAVAAARRTHEAFATHTSIIALGQRSADGERLLSDRSAYAKFLEQARNVGPRHEAAREWPDPEQVSAACQAALTACMQSTALTAVLREGTASFQLAAVPGRDWPDVRLRKLTAMAPTLWIPLRPPSERANAYRYALDAVTDALRSADRPTISTAEYQALLPELTAELDQLAGHRDHNVQLDTRGHTGVPGLFSTETIRARAPLPAKVQQLSERTHIERLITRDIEPEHLFITVRKSDALRAQFTLPPGNALPDDAPVAAIVTPTRHAGQVTELTLTVLPEPAHLKLLSTPIPILTCLSLDCLLNDVWQHAWLKPLRRRTRVIGLLDLPVEPTLDAWLNSGVPLRVGLLTTTRTAQAEHAVAFCFGSDEPVILPVTPIALFALTSYVERVSAGRVTIEDELLNATDETAARLVLGHLVSEDSVRGPGLGPARFG